LLPLVATPVAVGIVFNLFYDPTIGFANWILSNFGIKGIQWISNTATVLPALVLVDVWQWTPMITLICLAGLASLPSDPYESARVDGATAPQVLFRITLPMLAPTILTAMILRSIDALKTFDIIYAMTGGGPGYASTTLNVLGFKYAFEQFKFGQASVMLIVLFALVLGCSLVIMKLRARVEA
jgi:multiple sugar transport system permease protein